MSYAEIIQNISRAESAWSQEATPSPTGCRYFDYSAGQPNLYLLMKFKQALVAEFGLTKGFAIYRQTVTRHAGARLGARPLESQLAFAKARAAAFTELAPAGEAFIIRPPRVIGPGDHRPLSGSTRSFYIACLADAHIRGRSEVIDVGECSLLDFQGLELSRIDDELEFDSAVFHRTNDTVYDIIPGSDADSTEVDEAFTLLGAHTDFFGHWMCEYLPRYVAAVLSGGVPPVPVLIDAHMPRPHRQALELMLVDPIPIIEIAAFATVSVCRLWCAPNLSYRPLHERVNERFKWDYLASAPLRDAPVLEEMSRRADLALGNKSGPGRVFLAREDFRHRKLVNCAAIETIAKRRGFALVYPEDLDFVEQVRLVRTARFVIAPEGSALFLTFFARPGLRLCILNHPLTEALALYEGPLAEKAVDITVLTGPEVKKGHELPQDSDYRIDETGFSDFLDGWLAGDGHVGPLPVAMP
ncbi:MAG: glycosyltransferase family 61 protein [Stellaceae bacterium]